MKNTPVDIMKECAALMKNEDTLAYFDFKIRAGEATLEGLCRIGHPRRDASGKEYISLVFIVDTPNTDLRERVAAALRPLGSGVLEGRLPEIFSAISVPPQACPPQVYIKQFDLILKELFTASQNFISLRLSPALNATLHLESGVLGWWEELKKEIPAAAPAGLAEKRPSRSFITRLQEKLFR